MRWSLVSKSDRDVLVLTVKPGAIINSSLIYTMCMMYPFRIHGPILTNQVLNIEFLHTEPLLHTVSLSQHPPQKNVEYALECDTGGRDFGRFGVESLLTGKHQVKMTAKKRRHLFEVSSTLCSFSCPFGDADSTVWQDLFQEKSYTLALSIKKFSLVCLFLYICLQVCRNLFLPLSASLGFACLFVCLLVY